MIHFSLVKKNEDEGLINIRVVIKSREPGIYPATMSVAPGYFYGKTEEK